MEKEERKELYELIDTLEENGFVQEARDVRFVTAYIGNVENALEEVLGELAFLRKEIDRIHNQSLKVKCQNLIMTAETKITQGVASVKAIQTELVEKAKAGMTAFREKGADILAEVVRGIKIPEAYDKLAQICHGISEHMGKQSVMFEAIRGEFHSAKEHMKNIGRVLLGKPLPDKAVTDQEQRMTSGLSRLFQRFEKRFAGLEKKAMDKADALRVHRVKGSVKESLHRYQAATKQRSYVKKDQKER